ncbi:MAG: hypothetical protein JNM56_13610 [Planctomycetia bacterium]|nr:hypothetical protein [Planctomycetia bacterium]
MNQPSRSIRWIFLAIVSLFLVGHGQAQDKKAEPAGKHVTAAGMLLQREAGKPWQAPKQGAEVASGKLLVALPGAALDSKNGAVRLALLSDLDGISPFPVLESAVVLHPAGDADLDFTLDRGRVEVTNQKTKGAAKVRVHFRKEVWELTLAEPGARATIELYGRWPRGVFFSKDDKNPAEPTAALVLLVLKGEADLKYGNRQIVLKQPPGPALFQWDSAAGPDSAPQRLEKLPPWADPEAKPTPEAKERLARIEKVRQKLASEAPEAVIGELLKSKEPGERRLALVALGATDDLPRLLDALNHTEHADIREEAIMALRHWIGRGPGQDLKLYNALTQEKKYSPAQAEIVLRLLHSFGEADLGRPETYEALIAYLKHDRVSIRELARWHLIRLVPAGKAIKYDAAGTPKDRDAAYAEWKKLVPEGELPKKPEKKE